MPGGPEGIWSARMAFVLALGILLIAIALGAHPLLLVMLLLQVGFLGWLRFRGEGAQRRTLVVSRDADTSPDIRAALDALPSPTILVDRQAIIQHANRAAFEAFPGLRAGFR